MPIKRPCGGKLDTIGKTLVHVRTSLLKNIDDVLREEAGCTAELDCTEQTSWLLFLKYLDGLEQDKADEARWRVGSTDLLLSSAPKLAQRKTYKTSTFGV